MSRKQKQPEIQVFDLLLTLDGKIEIANEFENIEGLTCGQIHCEEIAEARRLRDAMQNAIDTYIFMLDFKQKLIEAEKRK